MTTREVIEELLAYEQARARLLGLSDCTCIGHSRVAERAYETGQCPHQKARAALKCSSTAGSCFPVDPVAYWAANMARLSASEVACYKWPEDTREHKALRAAFMEGAAHSATSS